MIVNQYLKMISKKILFFSFFSLLFFSHFSYASNIEERDDADKKQVKLGYNIDVRDIELSCSNNRKAKTKGGQRVDKQIINQEPESKCYFHCCCCDCYCLIM